MSVRFAQTESIDIPDLTTFKGEWRRDTKFDRRWLTRPTRHVRVHHVDKDKDDIALRDVLAQRNEGAGKARRRRTNGSIGSSGG